MTSHCTFQFLSLEYSAGGHDVFLEIYLGVFRTDQSRDVATSFDVFRFFCKQKRVELCWLGVPVRAKMLVPTLDFCFPRGFGDARYISEQVKKTIRRCCWQFNFFKHKINYPMNTFEMILVPVIFSTSHLWIPSFWGSYFISHLRNCPSFTWCKCLLSLTSNVWGEN